MLRAFTALLASLSLVSGHGATPGSHRFALRAAARHGAAACTRETPTKLAFTRRDGHMAGTLSWKPGRRAPLGSSYRVLRDNRVVGDTYRHSLGVNVAFGRRYTLAVRLVSPTAQPIACATAVLHFDNRYRLPSAPTFPSIANTSETSVTVRWQPSLRGDAPVVGYRLMSDGSVDDQTKATSETLPAASNHSYTFTVMAVDADGHLSAPSAPVTVKIGHTPPPAPTLLEGDAVGSTGVELSWQPSVPAVGTVEGYRVLSGGETVGQFTGTTVTLSNLRPSTTYTYSVEAVDTQGYVSAPTVAVPVRTGNPQPPSAPGSLVGAAMSDSVVDLSWQASTPQQGTIIGYRITRDGSMVGQFSGTSAQITNLAASTSYSFGVEAIDSLGDVSQPSSVTVQTANPVPSTGHVYAFLLSDTDESFDDFEAHYQEIGTIAPTYYDCNLTSQLMEGSNVPLITDWAQARAVKVLPRINCQSTTVVHDILTNPTLTQEWLTAIMNEVNNNGYDGVTLDFEAGAETDRNALTAFVTQLATLLHEDGKELMLCVSPKTADVMNNPRSTFFDYNALSQEADVMFVMAWGIHWTTSAPGAEDDMTWESQVIKYISTLPRVNKYVLGLELYAMDWPNDGGAANPAAEMEYEQTMQLIASEGVTPTYSASADAWTFDYTDSSGTPHTVWYPDAATEGDRIAMAKANGFGGIGIWRLGEEDQGLWSNPNVTGSW